MSFSYDGSKYNGYQKQPDKNTIQDIIEEKLTQINSNNKVLLVASGRTDSGVHAISQRAHFDLDSDIDVDKLRNSINKMLPNTIFIKSVERVDDDFHARFTAKKKKYTYKINVGEYNPLDVNYIYQYNKGLDIELMNTAIKNFIGEHDFTSYTKGCEDKESYIRYIYDAYVESNNNIISITFIGNGFLRYMVRNMVGSLIDVGSKKICPDDVKKILDKKNRTMAGITAPSCGLYLVDVTYEK